MTSFIPGNISFGVSLGRHSSCSSVPFLNHGLRMSPISIQTRCCLRNGTTATLWKQPTFLCLSSWPLQVFRSTDGCSSTSSTVSARIHSRVETDTTRTSRSCLSWSQSSSLWAALSFSVKPTISQATVTSLMPMVSTSTARLSTLKCLRRKMKLWMKTSSAPFWRLRTHQSFCSIPFSRVTTWKASKVRKTQLAKHILKKRFTRGISTSGWWVSFYWVYNSLILISDLFKSLCSHGIASQTWVKPDGLSSLCCFQFVAQSCI